MKSKDGQKDSRLAPAMVEDKATERLKKRAQDLGLIVNAGLGGAARQSDKKKVGAKKTEGRQ